LIDEQFEALVVQAARLKLGKGVQGFAAGVDGGRDARFEGIADGFPSRSNPWSGVTIIQAKHTNAYGVYFSDPEFSGDGDNSVLTKEVPRAKKLREKGGLDNYMIYANRRLTGGANEIILQRLADEIGLPTDRIHLCGVEALDEAFREEPRLAALAGISPLDGPLIVSSRDLADIVEAVADHVAAVADGVPATPVERTTLAEKNELNAMSDEYSRRLLRNYSHLLRQIQSFLANPMNATIQDLYEACAEDFDLKIIAHREEHQTFDRAFNYLLDLLFSRDTLLSRNKRLTRAVVFYMYWNCDIGRSNDAVSQ
jgi:hypothetical protein